MCPITRVCASALLVQWRNRFSLWEHIHELILEFKSASCHLVSVVLVPPFQSGCSFNFTYEKRRRKTIEEALIYLLCVTCECHVDHFLSLDLMNNMWNTVKKTSPSRDGDASLNRDEEILMRKTDFFFACTHTLLLLNEVASFYVREHPKKNLKWISLSFEPVFDKIGISTIKKKTFLTMMMFTMASAREESSELGGFNSHSRLYGWQWLLKKFQPIAFLAALNSASLRSFSFILFCSPLFSHCITYNSDMWSFFFGWISLISYESHWLCCCGFYHWLFNFFSFLFRLEIFFLQLKLNYLPSARVDSPLSSELEFAA